MEKRIRIVWLLSLVSALLVILAQGYWLYSQYDFVATNYARELAEQVTESGEEEYNIRRMENPIQYTYVINRKSEMKGGSKEPQKSKAISMAISLPDSLNSSSIPVNEIDIASQILEEYERNPNEAGEKLKSNPANLQFSFNPEMSEDSLYNNLNRSVINQMNPFRIELLDSILSDKFDDLSYILTEQDSSVYTSEWNVSKGLFHSVLQVHYSYDPLAGKGVLVKMDIPSQPIFRRMIVQLTLAFGLILLLIGCLVFQIKTILKQQKLGELRQSFVNTMIHELKRPVQTLKTFISFLGDKELRTDDKATEQIVEDSMFELDNLSAYLNKLKDMIRIDDGQNAPLHISKFNLQELTEKVIRLVQKPEGKEVRFTIDFNMISPWIEADPIHIANILNNLIENAIKYSNEQVDIEIKAIRKGKELILTVSDNGIGIPLVEQEKVFVKFYRGSNLPDQGIPGLGLGLSYVKLISEAHQGYVSLKSSLGEGTSVSLILPQ